MRQSHTAVIERNASWSGTIETEPYEAGWADEALFFVRILDPQSGYPPVLLAVQISPDGIHWCDEGSVLQLNVDAALSWCRLSRFGAWLRLSGTLPHGLDIRVMVYLQIKG